MRGAWKRMTSIRLLRVGPIIFENFTILRRCFLGMKFDRAFFGSRAISVAARPTASARIVATTPKTSALLRRTNLRR